MPDKDIAAFAPLLERAGARSLAAFVQGATACGVRDGADGVAVSFNTTTTVEIVPDGAPASRLGAAVRAALTQRRTSTSGREHGVGVLCSQTKGAGE